MCSLVLPIGVVWSAMQRLYGAMSNMSTRISKLVMTTPIYVMHGAPTKRSERRYHASRTDAPDPAAIQPRARRLPPAWSPLNRLERRDQLRLPSAGAHLPP